MIGIYKITNPKGKVYIGQSVEIERRKWKYMSACCKNQIKIYRSLIKYGWLNHKFDVLIECEKHQLDELEVKYIKEYDSLNNGLNCTWGASSNNSLTQEHKDKIRQSLLGVKHTPERTNKIMKTKRSRIYIMSEETRIKMINNCKKNYNFLYSNNKIVIDLQTGVFYDSLKSASKFYPYNYNTLKGRLAGTKPNNTQLVYA